MRPFLRILFGTILSTAGTACATSPTVRSPSTIAAPPTAVPSASPPTTVAPSTTAPTPLPLRRDIRWVQSSAEYRALALQVYRNAAARLPDLSQGLAPGRWGVILDADETVLDNSEYQRRRAMVDSGYTAASWAVWVKERAAGAVPGAVEFTTLVQKKRGRVAIVTNRADSLCEATRDNLEKLGVVADIVLCQPPGEGDKNSRFQRIQSGAAAMGIPSLAIVEWIGDNILDFPGMIQESRNDSTAMANFGRQYFILPNPMYGSWEPLP